MFQRQGSGFLGSALTTAAGVAGGVVAGNALMNLFSGHEGGGGGMFGTGGGFGGGLQQPAEVVEYVPEPPPQDASWGGSPAGGPDPHMLPGGAPERIWLAGRVDHAGFRRLDGFWTTMTPIAAGP